MGLSYTVAIDVWSLGCILTEMHTGEPLLPGQDTQDQMAQIVQLLGMPPSSMIAQGRKKSRELLFTETGVGADGVPTFALKKGASLKMDPTHLRTVLGVETDGPRGRRKGEPGHTRQDYDLFLDLVSRMLCFE